MRLALWFLVACVPPDAAQQPQAQQGPPGDPSARMMAETGDSPEPAGPGHERMTPPPQARADDAPPPAPPRTEGGSKLPADAQQMVDAHNAARAKHCAAPLTWSPKLAKVAQAWANKLRDNNCAFDHSHGQYGENLAAGTTGYMDPNAVVAMWYEEIKDYDFTNPGFSMNTGHFTQVVWKGTSAVGCGMAQCKGMDVWVCNYDPAGNWDGQYKDNVLPTSCRK